MEHGHDARPVSLLQVNSRAEGGAFIRSLQTGFLGKKVEERIKADYNRSEWKKGEEENAIDTVIFTRCSVSDSRP